MLCEGNLEFALLIENSNNKKILKNYYYYYYYYYYCLTNNPTFCVESLVTSKYSAFPLRLYVELIFVLYFDLLIT